ncbi:MAG: hypothetical protein LBV08_04400 [Clostridiales bacterium]|jgi:hypothetical protein|nr:hypothetical protein [Clostridiales bacterium]
MQGNDTIYELAEAFLNTDSLKNDLNDSFGLVVKDLRRKYLSKINKAITTQKAQSAGNMSREIKLLNAIKPFAQPEMTNQLDNIIELMTNIHTVKSIHSQMINVKAASNDINGATVEFQVDPSVKKDGVYDFDYEAGYIPKNPPNQNIFFILFILLLFL